MALTTAALPAARMALSAAREEASLIGAELASTSRVGISAVGHGIEQGVQAEIRGLNPVAIRQAAREAGGESSLLARLSHPPSASTPSPVQSLSASTLESTLSSPSSSISQSASILASTGSTSSSTLRLAARETSSVTRAIEQDLGTTLREVLSNAGQQGVEEVGEQVPLSQALQELQAQGGLQQAQAVGGAA